MKKSHHLKEWFEDIALEIECKEHFLKIKETLTRIGYEDRKDIHQICHILSKHDSYYIVHWKEMLFLDSGNKYFFNSEDIFVRDTIANLLEVWGIIKIKDDNKVTYDEEIVVNDLYENNIVVIKYKNKEKYNLISHYDIGSKKDESKKEDK